MQSNRRSRRSIMREALKKWPTQSPIYYDLDDDIGKPEQHCPYLILECAIRVDNSLFISRTLSSFRETRECVN